MSKRSFFDIFPTPVFLNMPAVGLSISEDAVRFVELKSHKGTHTLKNYGEVRLSAGVIVDGVPVKNEEITSALKELKKNSHFSFANVVLPDNKGYIFTATVPVPEEGTLRDVVGFILEENIPIPPTGVVFDYTVVHQDVDANTADVIVSVFPQEQIRWYADICRWAGITPLSFDVESDATARAVISKSDGATRLLADFGSNNIMLSVVSDQRVQYSSVISLGFSDFPEKETEDSIKKVVAYWQSKSIGKTRTQNRIQSIIISGDVSKMPSIADYISKYSGLNSTLANVWQNALLLDEEIPEIKFEDSLRFASAIGAGISEI